MDVRKTRRVYEGRVVNLRVDTLPSPSGGTHDVEVVEHGGAVVVIVQPTPDTMLLVKQYRHPVGRETWEAVAGGMDPGESPVDAARRELREETGYVARDVRHLFSGYSAPGFCTELLHFCRAEGYEIGATDPDPDEQIEVGIFPVDELWSKIQRGELQDCKTQVAVLWALTARNAS
ncbi:MAG TPA: NUDIX hydrolase [Candidatus Sulfotelmatobacter sp.]|nr:NUDIX hydrolase [Candidatus Sulfotelmatobacter sp.]